MSHRLVAVLIVSAACVLAVAGCSSSDPPPENSRAPLASDAVRGLTEGAVDRLPEATAVAVRVPSLEDVGDPPVAGDVIAALQRLTRPIGEIEIVTDTEARFVDTRIAGTGAQVDLRNGGVVEISEKPVDLRPKPGMFDLLGTLLPAPLHPARLTPGTPEHRLAQGRILLRLSSRHSPDSVQRYAIALSRIKG
jgi:hypothetical protein